MPITQSAKKALRGSFTKKAMNDRNKKDIKEAVKKIEKLVKEKKKAEAKKLLPEAYSVIDKGESSRKIPLHAKNPDFQK